MKPAAAPQGVTTAPVDPTLAWDRIETILEALVARLGRLEASVDSIAMRLSGLRVQEQTVLGGLIPAALRAVGEATFTAGDLLSVPVCARHARGYDATKLARLLGRVQGVPIAGIWVERVGTDRDGALWRFAARIAAQSGPKLR